MMILVLRLMCGGFWMISYSIAIYKGIKEKSYAMPFFSLCLNISWEMLYFKKVINGGDGGLIWIIIDSIWLILDAGILITYFLYGKKYYPDKLKKYFWGFSIFQLIIAMLIMNEFYTTYPFHAKINCRLLYKYCNVYAIYRYVSKEKWKRGTINNIGNYEIYWNISGNNIKWILLWSNKSNFTCFGWNICYFGYYVYLFTDNMG